MSGLLKPEECELGQGVDMLSETKPAVEIDPELRPVLQELDAERTLVTVENIQRTRAKSAQRLAQRPEAGTTQPVRKAIKTPNGELEAWVFAADGDSVKPCLLWFHGGGYVMGMARDLWYGQFFAERAGCTVVSLEYRLAPEHCAPAAVEDGIAALGWVVAHAAELHIDPAKIIVGGASAGGGVAAGVAVRNRDLDGPDIALQMLLYPMLDRRHESEFSRRDGFPIWWRAQSLAAWEMYLGRDPKPDVIRYAAVAEAPDVSDLPPARLFAGTADLFHDEIRSYHKRLTDAGVDSEFRSYPGMFHGGEVAGCETAIGQKMCADYERAISEFFGSPRAGKECVDG